MEPWEGCGTSAGSLVGGVGVQEIPELVPTHWWVNQIPGASADPGWVEPCPGVCCSAQGSQSWCQITGGCGSFITYWLQGPLLSEACLGLLWAGPGAGLQVCGLGSAPGG